VIQPAPHTSGDGTPFEQYTWPVASGIIAGGSLMGVALVIWENGPSILKSVLVP
jgi:hypothetical protein